MAAIVLKDENGTPITYEGVTQIEVNGTDRTHKFTKLSVLNSYAVTQQTDGKYLVQKKLQYLPSNNYFYFALNNTEFEAFSKELTDGTSAVVIFVTPKSLVIGNTYTAEEMY